MKKRLLAGLLLAGLSGCSKKEDAAPAPQLQGGTWTFQSETVATTPKSGGSTTTAPSTAVAGSVTIAFTDATNFTTTVAGINGTGTYIYGTNTLSLIPGSGSAAALSAKFNVSELSTSKLVLTDNGEDATNRYVTTDMFTR
jgi:hypothetical protein